MWDVMESANFTTSNKYKGENIVIFSKLINGSFDAYSLITSLTIQCQLSKLDAYFRLRDSNNNIFMNQPIPRVSVDRKSNTQILMIPFWARDSLKSSENLVFEILVSNKTKMYFNISYTILFSRTSHLQRLMPPALVSEMMRAPQVVGNAAEPPPVTKPSRRKIPRLLRRAQIGENSIPGSVFKRAYFDTAESVPQNCDVDSDQTNIIPLYKRNVVNVVPGQSTVVLDRTF